MPKITAVSYGLITLVLGLLLISACRKEHVDPVYVVGSRENSCKTLANNKSEQKYGVPAAQSVKINNKKTSVWIGGTEFSFGESDYFMLQNTYKAEPYNNEGAKFIEGIQAGRNFNISEMAYLYPSVFKASSAPAVFYLQLSCTAGKKNPDFNKPYTQGSMESIDTKIGLINYSYRNGVNSVPANKSITNPDGTAILIECSYIDNSCEAVFTLESNVLVRYYYPFSQRDNWLEIQKFLVSSLTKAKE
jgi:hypothetical protein